MRGSEGTRLIALALQLVDDIQGQIRCATRIARESELCTFVRGILLSCGRWPFQGQGMLGYETVCGIKFSSQAALCSVSHPPRPRAPSLRQASDHTLSRKFTAPVHQMGISVCYSRAITSRRHTTFALAFPTHLHSEHADCIPVLLRSAGTVPGPSLSSRDVAARTGTQKRSAGHRSSVKLFLFVVASSTQTSAY
jgi:hypothetical protein